MIDAGSIWEERDVSLVDGHYSFVYFGSAYVLSYHVSLPFAIRVVLRVVLVTVWWDYVYALHVLSLRNLRPIPHTFGLPAAPTCKYRRILWMIDEQMQSETYAS